MSTGAAVLIWTAWFALTSWYCLLTHTDIEKCFLIYLFFSPQLKWCQQRHQGADCKCFQPELNVMDVSMFFVINNLLMSNLKWKVPVPDWQLTWRHLHAVTRLPHRVGEADLPKLQLRVAKQRRWWSVNRAQLVTLLPSPRSIIRWSMAALHVTYCDNMSGMKIGTLHDLIWRARARDIERALFGGCVFICGAPGRLYSQSPSALRLRLVSAADLSSPAIPTSVPLD